jgi:hypothetical protein
MTAPEEKAAFEADCIAKIANALVLGMERDAEMVARGLVVCAGVMVEDQDAVVRAAVALAMRQTAEKLSPETALLLKRKQLARG